MTRFTRFIAYCHYLTGRFWEKPITFLSKVTGRRSVDLAMPIFAFGAVMRVVGAGVYVGRKGPSVLSLIHVAAVLFVTALLYAYMKVAVQNARDSTGDKLFFSFEDAQLIVWRPLGTLFVIWHVGTVWVMPWNVFEMLGWVGVSLGMWAVWFNVPGGKSVFAKAKDRVKQWMDTRTPVLRPLPV